MTTPPPIQRYELVQRTTMGDQNIGEMEPDSYNGDYVLYSDHLTAMAAAVPRWIPCSERMPDEGVSVLVFTLNGRIDIDHRAAVPTFAHIGQWTGIAPGNDVTHWMKLPEAPK